MAGKPRAETDRRVEPRDVALRLLARREHSRRELLWKLRQRGIPMPEGEEALDRLEDQGLLSDERFAESYVTSRSERGYGPLRIRAGLLERGVAKAIIDRKLQSAEVDWTALAVSVYRKRFGFEAAVDARGLAQRLRFMQQRGFDAATIRAATDLDAWE